MKFKFLLFIWSLLLFINHGILLAQEEVSTFNMINFPSAMLPEDMTDTPLDIEITKQSKLLPKYIQTQINMLDEGRISFLPIDLLFEKLEELIEYENKNVLIDSTLKLTPQIPDGFLFIDILRSQLGRLTIKAQVLDANRSEVADAEVDLLTEYITYQDSLRLKAKKLAQQIIKKLEVNGLIPVQHEEDNGGSILKNLKFWTGVATAGSATWYFWEERSVNSNYDDYRNGSSIEEVTQARIKTEKSETRRNIVFAATVVSATSLVYFSIIKPLIFKSNKVEITQNSRYRKEQQKIGIVFHPNLYDDRISLNVRINF